MTRGLNWSSEACFHVSVELEPQCLGKPEKCFGFVYALPSSAGLVLNMSQWNRSVAVLPSQRNAWKRKNNSISIENTDYSGEQRQVKSWVIKIFFQHAIGIHTHTHLLQDRLIWAFNVINDLSCADFLRKRNWKSTNDITFSLNCKLFLCRFQDRDRWGSPTVCLTA